MLKIRDASTRKVVFYVDDVASEVARDANGKVVARVASREPEVLTLTKAGHLLLTGSRRVTSSGEGRLVAMDLSPGDVAAPNAARAAFVEVAPDFIADQVAPVRLVKHDRGTWWIENPGDSIQQVLAIESSAGGAGAELNPTFTKTAFTCTGYGVSARLPRGIVATADFDISLVALKRGITALRLAREVRVASMLLAASNWATGNVVSAGSKWNGGVSPDPLGDLFAARSKSFLPPSAMVLSEAAEPYFFANANGRVRDFVQSGGVLPRVLVGRARIMNAAVASYVWSPSTPANAALIVEANDPDTGLGTARTLRWLGAGPDSEMQDGLLVRRFKSIDSEFEFVVAVHNDAEIMLQNASTVGAVITGVLQ
jgi:hypothetical protein